MTETASTDIEIETPPAPVVEKQDEFVKNLSKIYQRLKYSKKHCCPVNFQSKTI